MLDRVFTVSHISPNINKSLKIWSLTTCYWQLYLSKKIGKIFFQFGKIIKGSLLINSSYTHTTSQFHGTTLKSFIFFSWQHSCTSGLSGPYYSGLITIDFFGWLIWILTSKYVKLQWVAKVLRGLMEKQRSLRVR